jgi:two-component system response regulator CpxR
MNRLLIIDDDTELCELLSDYLIPEGFTVQGVHDGEAGAILALSGQHDLVVLDVMLPGLNGFEVLRRIRFASMIPVLMLTARGDDVDRIVGLEMGADDYLPKPFNPRELVARIRAIQRRAVAELDGSQLAQEREARLVVGDLDLNPATRILARSGERIELTAVEFSLLQILLKHPGQVASRDDLAETVLGRKLEIFDRSIDVHVSSLRKKLGRLTDGRERISSVRGVGYQYVISE